MLQQEDSGSELAPISYSAYKDETVSIRGSIPIEASKFQKIVDQATLKRIRPDLRDSIKVLDLTAAQIKHIKNMQTNLIQTETSLNYL